MLLGTFSLLKWPFIENTIWSSGHTVVKHEMEMDVTMITYDGQSK